MLFYVCIYRTVINLLRMKKKLKSNHRNINDLMHEINYKTDTLRVFFDIIFIMNI